MTRLSFDEPIVMASASQEHDTHPLMLASGELSVSILVADQIAEGQSFGYPGRKLCRMAGEYRTGWPDDPLGPPIVPNSAAWLRCRIFERMTMEDHDLVFARGVDVAEGGSSSRRWRTRAAWGGG